MYPAVFVDLQVEVTESLKILTRLWRTDGPTHPLIEMQKRKNAFGNSFENVIDDFRFEEKEKEKSQFHDLTFTRIQFQRENMKMEMFDICRSLLTFSLKEA